MLPMNGIPANADLHDLTAAVSLGEQAFNQVRDDADPRGMAETCSAPAHLTK